MRDGRATEFGFARARRLLSDRSRIYPTSPERIGVRGAPSTGSETCPSPQPSSRKEREEGVPPSVPHACASTSRECALISPAISLRWALRRGWRWGRLAGDMRSRIRRTCEHRESCETAVEGQYQSALLDLAHLPPVDVISDAHPPDLAARSRLHHRARILVIHHDAE